MADSLGNKYLWKVFRVTNRRLRNKSRVETSFDHLDEALELRLNELENEGWDVHTIMPTDGGGGVNVVARKFYVDEQRNTEILPFSFGENE
jgi:hypothetical protein